MFNTLHTGLKSVDQAIISLLMIFLSVEASSQSFHKNSEIASMNLGLHLKMTESPDSEQLIFVLVKGDPSCVEELTFSTGGEFIAKAGDISSIGIPVKSLALLLASKCIRRIEAYPKNVQPLNDTMRMLSRVDEVHQGIAPLSQAYTGKNILIGYIDSGLDLNHPDFKDSLGNTRVAWLWDMTKAPGPNTPLPYGYGQEWSAADINNGLAVSHTGEDQFGHGTYVAGIGSGNGRATGSFKGVAPESDILIVSYDFAAQDTVPRVAHAIDYLFNKASILGKPCVINASLGDYIGSHDGMDLESQFISNLINMQSGRVVVAAAGNIGLYPFHVGRTSSVGDTAFTWFKYNSGYGAAYVQIFSDTANFNQISFAIGVDKVTPYFDYRGSTVFSNVSSTLNNVITRTVFNGPNRLGVVQTLATQNEGVYQLEVYVVPDSINYYWRFTTAGQGHYDSWSFDWQFQNLPAPGVFPPIVNYHSPDTFQTIVTGPACLDNVIAVGNYFNTDRHIDVNGTLQISPGDQPGNLAGNSSRGPTRDGRIKPDISAPGHHIISAGVLTQIPGMIAAQPYKVASGGYHVTGGGTSASAPVVAGIAALYLEQNPAANWQDVKSAILGCAMQDAYTWLPNPNNAWGYGKADAFTTLTVCGMVSVMPAASDLFLHEVFPNPANELLHIRFSENIPGPHIHVDIFNPQAQIVKSVTTSSRVTTLNVQDLSAGIYFLKIRDSYNHVSVHRFSLIR